MDSRSPPNLLYLTVYNPTLRPADTTLTDDEDAEEQAHILFYTSKERAVSRDRMLRQVGLAKALVNFSDMFNPDDLCNNIHSQGRRIVMVSPEPDFWITACVELAKTFRTPTIERNKGKQKSKTGTISKDVALVCNYQDFSVDDISLRADIRRGYEQFKLVHGSLTSILSTLGQQALELQLERFFTPWAWSWDLECDRGFGDHLVVGIPLHPQYRTIVPLLDEFASQIPATASSIIVTPSHVIPSTSFIKARYPSPFPAHLMSLIPPPPPPSPQAPPGSPVKKRPPDPEADIQPSSFLGMPTMNLNMNVDVRKWGWPGYLTFKGSAKRLEVPMAEVKPRTSRDEGEIESVDVDKSALDDAIKSDVISVPSTKPTNGNAENPCHGNESVNSETRAGSSQSSSLGSSNASLSINEKAASQGSHGDHVESSASSHGDDSASSKKGCNSSPSLVPPPELSSITVYLSDPPDGLDTRRSKVVYMAQHPVLVALVGLKDVDYDLSLAGKVRTLCMDVQKVLDDDALTSSTETLPSATKILQPKDRHLVSRAKFTLSNDKFAAKSEQFYIAQHLLESDLDVREVFSRGVNPQHWHIVQRALNRDTDGDVYLEISRKETSLSDVDNVLAGVVRRYSSVDAFPS
ncbi:uncharacterized protein BT62DRAFT_912493 [Guyanagaster necrorhizus]|uniref:CCZ1/INTU/HSP4 first Longin domain-containing protein n=1 Tax=Guyanagaster necrorhizus TaxID=856835 RepID=A0A9P7VG56_9AGAR|nr:uncharacterized protein BT62DRAFT_912493 [Guyanagaster necrorhizus MCA 3950]KAG7439785.1 hypothetical protein BT62DRAFT_912493 [Guyanagaster necrorhizus MCA 3950]